MSEWPYYALHRLATKIGSGATPRGGRETYHSDGIPLIRSMNVHFSGFRREGLAFINHAQAVALDNVRVSSRDVLLNITGASIGRVTIAPEDMEGARVNQHVCIIRPNHSIDPRFLSYYLSSAAIQRQISEEQSGVTRQALTKLKVLNFEIPVPPPAEQQRIVAVIEDHFSRLDEAVMLLERVQRNLKRYRVSVLKAAVEGRLVPTEAELARAEDRDYEPASVLLNRILAERRKRWEMLKRRGKYLEPIKGNDSSLAQLPEGWCWTTVDQLTAGDRNSGYGVLVPGSDIANGVKLIRVGDINDDGVIQTEGLKQISRHIADKFSKTYLSGNEVLITLVGTIGRTAIVPKCLAGSNVARAVGMIPVTELVAPHWLELWLRNPDTRAIMTSKSHEVARKTLNLEDVRSAPVALAPYSEQLRIHEKVQEMESLAQEGFLLVASSLRRSVTLRQSVLKWAFEGKLADQDPSEEPASALLERIRAEREAAMIKTKPKALRRKA